MQSGPAKLPVSAIPAATVSPAVLSRLPEKGLPASRSRPEPDHRTVNVLAVSPHEEDHVALAHIFAHTRWNIHWAKSEEEALSHLARHPVEVLICDATGATVNWKRLQQKLASTPHPPQIIVSSANADACFWAEALNLGAYDVLAKPFDWSEVRRVVSLAWLHWVDEEIQLAHVPRKAAATLS